MKLELNNTVGVPVTAELLRRAAEVVSNQYDAGERRVSVAFVSAAEMRRLNNLYRGRDAVTDVLSFADDESSEELGELILCYERIVQQSEQFDTTPHEELVFIFIHGLLHLLGYEDETQKGHEEMLRIGRELTDKTLQS